MSIKNIVANNELTYDFEKIINGFSWKSFANGLLLYAVIMGSVMGSVLVLKEFSGISHSTLSSIGLIIGLCLLVGNVIIIKKVQSDSVSIGYIGGIFILTMGLIVMLSLEPISYSYIITDGVFLGIAPVYTTWIHKLILSLIVLFMGPVMCLVVFSIRTRSFGVWISQLILGNLGICLFWSLNLLYHKIVYDCINDRREYFNK